MTTVTVHAGASGVMQEVVFGSSESPTDKPDAHDEAGGAPSPYDYLLMALGA
jgi:uncharacterized OsmC-like protein